MRAPLTLIILLAVFLAPQRSASTQALPQGTPTQDDTPTKIEMIRGHKAVAGDVIVRFSDAPEDQVQTFVENVVSMVRASKHNRIGPASLNMFHIRSKE